MGLFPVSGESYKIDLTHRPRGTQQFQHQERMFIKVVNDNSMKTTADSFQFGQLPTIAKGENFYEHIVAN